MPPSPSATSPTPSPIALPTGVTLSYVEQGSPTGVPVVLLHGLTDSLRSYELVCPHLPASIRAFSVSQRGHGDSSRPGAGYRPQDFAADLAAFLDSFEIERAVVVGHSMSSGIALRFAIDYPERTLGIVLVGAFATIADHPTWVEVQQAAAGLRDPIDRDFVVEFQQSTLAQPIPSAYFETVVQESLKVPVSVFQTVCADFRANDHTAGITRIKAPTLIVWGDQDTYFPRADQDALVAAIAGSRLLEYRGAGHALHWEEPERFAADVAAFAHKLG